MDTHARWLVTVLLVIAAILLALFVYEFLFTSKYRNMDGEDVRQEFAYINKEKKIEREYKARTEPKVEKPVKKNKTDEVRAQEELENSEEKVGNSDLHNMYK